MKRNIHSGFKYAAVFGWIIALCMMPALIDQHTPLIHFVQIVNAPLTWFFSFGSLKIENHYLIGLAVFDYIEYTIQPLMLAYIWWLRTPLTFKIAIESFLLSFGWIIIINIPLMKIVWQLIEVGLIPPFI